MQVQAALAKLAAGDRLDQSQTEQIFDALLEGAMDEAQIASFLSLIQARRPTVDELVGAARAMRRRVVGVTAPKDELPLLDTAGTGGTRKTFNVSTCAAVVAASTGLVRVAKHGNRSRTGRGSTEVLAALDVDVDATPEVQARCLAECGICFSFAVNHHPAARHAAGVRRSLGFPTMFNLLGPLTNPAGARRQVMGVFGRDWVEPIARVLQRLGAERAMVVHSHDGLDEIAITAPTTIAHVDPEGIRWELFDPASLGLGVAPIESLEAATLDDAVTMFRAVLDGEPSPAQSCVLLNAAAVLVTGGVVPDMAAGVAASSQAIADGRAVKTLASLAALSHSA